jgi:hypothetical protein
MIRRRFATAGEQAGVVAFLLSGEASSVNGVTIRVEFGVLHGFRSLTELKPPIPGMPK